MKLCRGKQTTSQNSPHSILIEVISMKANVCVLIGSKRLELNKFRCYDVKIEESEKAASHQESNSGHLWLESPVLCH